MLLGVPRPKYGADEREPDDTLGAIFRALMVGLLAGGRGTDREADKPGDAPGRAPVIPSDLAPAPAEAAGNDLPLLCGVLDTLRAAAGDEDASDRPSEPRFAMDEAEDPRFAIGEPAP